MDNKIDDNTKQYIIDELHDDLHKYLKSNPTINICIDKSEEDDYYGGGLHCSGIGACLRQQVMSYYNFEAKEYTLQQLLNFNRGNYYHELVYQWLGNSNKFLIIDKEKKVTDNLPKPYRGKFDVCIMHTATRLQILTDVKTANANLFKKYSNYLPIDKHIYQLTLYKKGYLNDVDLSMIMYFSNGNDKPQFYFIEPYGDIDNLTNKYIQAVDYYKETQILPPVLDETFNKKEIWQCSYCQYYQLNCDGYKKE